MNIKTVVTLYPDKIVSEYLGQDGKDVFVIKRQSVLPKSLVEMYGIECRFMLDAFLTKPHGELVFRAVEDKDEHKDSGNIGR